MKHLFDSLPGLAAALVALVTWTAAAQQPPPAALSAPPAPELRSLQADLERLIESSDWNASRSGVLVVSLDRGDTLFSRNADAALVPASNMKLYTTAAALYYLGPRFRYSTYVLGAGDVRDGALEGDLVLYGTGDPAISRRLLDGSGAVLGALADSLYASGVREVRGDVVGDGSFFDSAWIGEGWKEGDRMRWYAAPVGALSLAENMVDVRVRPGASAGEPARIRTDPGTHGLSIRNEVRTVARGATRVRFEHGEHGLRITGQVRRGSAGVERSVPVVDPANYTAAAFYSALQERGIRITGGVRSVGEPSASAVTQAATSPPARRASEAPRVLAVHLSPPLRDLIGVTNQISHNLYAEAMLKTVGRVAIGEGTFAGGARAVRYFMECETATDSTALQIVDGSGLSRFNRVTPRSMIALLDYMARAEEWEAFQGSLPLAASELPTRHSLRDRMRRSGAAGNLRAKTGTIQDVSSLSGYVRTADGERLAFAILGNDLPSTWRAKSVEDDIGERLASFQRGAPVEASGVEAAGR